MVSKNKRQKMRAGGNRSKGETGIRTNEIGLIIKTEIGLIIKTEIGLMEIELILF